MPRRTLIAGNWKLNLAPREAVSHATNLREALAGRGEVDVAVFPTALAATSVAAALTGSGIEVGVQDVHWQDSGAFTGATSAAQARDCGCTRALVGHSERRTLFGDTDDVVAKKLRTARLAGLLPVLCVGETLGERDAGRVEAVLDRQLATAFAGWEPDEIGTVTVAYEPVWAIGTGRTATPEQAQAAHAHLRGWLHGRVGRLAEEIRILYGGSVNAGNAQALLGSPDVDGALVGGASLDVGAFGVIVGAASTP